ncbi:MAG TPA: imidazolonepropionase, partial [Chitinophagaceae bacterium]|nr:imidazolonepropionase [Chitinophagaceae bacterium]
MGSQLITNIKLLVNTRDQQKVLRGAELADLPCIENAFLIVEDDEIAAFGKMDTPGAPASGFTNVYDATGQLVLPAWCDSHTHLVFASSRESEFIDKIRGLSYAEIAARGGGILNSAKKLNDTS